MYAQRNWQWSVPQAVAACAVGFLLAAAGSSADTGAVEAMLDVDLGFDNVSGFDTTADVFCSAATPDPCEGAGSVSAAGASPVVLLYPGFSGGKEEYSAFATILAEAGYFVMVLQQLVAPILPVPEEFDVPSGPSNIVRPSATALALDWPNAGAEKDLFRGYGGYGAEPVMPACMAVDTDKVLLVGHSYGCTAAKQTLEAGTAIEVELYGFEPVALPVYPEIKGAFLFGLGPLNQQRTPALPERRILVATGDLDYNAMNYSTSDNESYLTLADIDHFSIANSYFIEPRLSGKTSRSFPEAQAVVGEVGIAALNSMHCEHASVPNLNSSLPEYVVDAFGVEEGLVDWVSWLPL